MSNAYPVGSEVSWKWGNGTAVGKVKQVFERRVQRTIKGAKIVRRATPDDPAYLIEQADGDRALKAHSEIRKA